MTYTEAVASHFRAHAGEWIDGLSLAQIGGAYAWRSRLTDVRRLGMTIENRQRRVGNRVVSEYRYAPVVGQQELGL